LDSKKKIDLFGLERPHTHYIPYYLNNTFGKKKRSKTPPRDNTTKKKKKKKKKKKTKRVPPTRRQSALFCRRFPKGKKSGGIVLSKYEYSKWGKEDAFSYR
tara:strand:- start:162 stop:464 length:303 start_codon:yes stop_codon:yes gene_type:complete